MATAHCARLPEKRRKADPHSRNVNVALPTLGPTMRATLSARMTPFTRIAEPRAADAAERTRRWRERGTAAVPASRAGPLWFRPRYLGSSTGGVGVEGDVVGVVGVAVVGGALVGGGLPLSVGVSDGVMVGLQLDGGGR
ncbi:hypothetical protein BZB76_1816 [Actinomadura pelletieri DSM 43383]|uniref:Uncharacterized protein n=1 Tax=Actinomadura pelletieri DSM 43383 TaxID=1120940 RepID=A0A495QSS3_9ACTN|nr:hypothetical protein BZB76_1816 [Actinomadura pelletieri DSM 43383]